MKKLIPALLLAGVFAVTSCKAQSVSSDSAKKKLADKSYAVTIYSETEAKGLIAGLNYEGVSFKDAIYAQKGEGEAKDIFLAFFFNDINGASNFVAKDNNANLVLLHDYGEKHLGANLTLKVGTHNNVAYVGSETSFTVALN